VPADDGVGDPDRGANLAVGGLEVSSDSHPFWTGNGRTLECKGRVVLPALRAPLDAGHRRWLAGPLGVLLYNGRQRTALSKVR